jgi:protein-S-isoprenylcysteine O-methyltransferase Ste14
MKLKGIDKLREKLPAYPGKRIFLLPLRGIIGAVLVYCVLILIDILPRLFPDIALLTILEPVLPILGTLCFGILAVQLIAMLWKRRDQMRQEYGDLAYQMMIPKGVMGVMLIPSVIFHAATSIRSLPFGVPVNDWTTQFSQSLLPLLGIPSEIDVLLRLILSGVAVILGLLVIRSAILTFGIDYMMVVYLYFPEESEVQNHEIYSVVRHPTYMGGVILAVAAMIFRCSVYSILLGIIGFLIFRVHLFREEAELLDRFGEGYGDYMKNVPALHVRLRDLKSLVKFLRVRET